MSRSYKKHPYAKDKTNKCMKKLSNKKIRQKLKNPEEELQHNSYKKVFQSWNICDYKFFSTWEQFWNFSINLWERFDKNKGVPFPDEKKEYARWRKWYKQK